MAYQKFVAGKPVLERQGNMTVMPLAYVPLPEEGKRGETSKKPRAVSCAVLEFRKPQPDEPRSE